MDLLWVFILHRGLFSTLPISSHMLKIITQLLHKYKTIMQVMHTLLSYVNRLVQERCNSSAIAMELHLPCTKPLMCSCCKMTMKTSPCCWTGWYLGWMFWHHLTRWNNHFYGITIIFKMLLTTWGHHHINLYLLTPNMLNCFRYCRIYIHIHILNFTLDLTLPNWMKLVVEQHCMLSVLHSQYSGDFRIQSISTHGIDSQTGIFHQQHQKS